MAFPKNGEASGIFRTMSRAIVVTLMKNGVNLKYQKQRNAMSSHAILVCLMAGVDSVGKIKKDKIE